MSSISSSSTHSVFIDHTPLEGVPASITYSYLGNIQILQMMLNKSDVSEVVKDIDKIITPVDKESILDVLAAKLESIAMTSTFKVVCDDKPEKNTKNGSEIVRLKSRLLELDASETMINNEQLCEISKILFLTKAQSVKTFTLVRCPNIKAATLPKQLTLYPSVRIITSNFNIPILSSSQFDKIKNFFRNTSLASIFNKLELVRTQKDFPHVLEVISDGRSRYFKLNHDLIVRAGQALMTNNPISKDEIELLTAIKQQCEIGTQLIMDISTSDLNKVLPIWKKQCGNRLKDLFQVPSRRDGYVTFVANLTKIEFINDI